LGHGAASFLSRGLEVDTPGSVPRWVASIGVVLPTQRGKPEGPGKPVLDLQEGNKINQPRFGYWILGQSGVPDPRRTLPRMQWVG